MTRLLSTRATKSTIRIWCIPAKKRRTALKGLPKTQAAYALTSQFTASNGSVLLLPARDGSLAGVLLGTGSSSDSFVAGVLPGRLPRGSYRFETLPDGISEGTMALAWLLGSYSFDRYKTKKKKSAVPRLVVSADTDAVEVQRIYDAAHLVRDLINTPANDMGPDELEAAARDLAASHGAKIKVIKGDALLKQNFPMIHAVGRASVREPRLIDISWGSEKNPRVSLVGKGVCFDTGGLNLKPGSSMSKMKKDMGGAAHVLGLASLIMSADLPVRLRVLVPAVENSIGGRAYRPGDVLPSRKGITVEIGNTDAEGRLVLADALVLADSESPDVLFNMATLTGAARVALGADLPPFYTTDDGFAAELSEQGRAVNDPVWRMPFWSNYRRLLDSKIADINHISSSRYAGSITAALFLKEFVESARLFAHFDVYAWTDRSSPGRPAGAEAQAIRAMYEVLKRRYPTG